MKIFLNKWLLYGWRGLALAIVVLQTADGLGQVCDYVPAGLVGWWQGEGNAIDRKNGNNGYWSGNVTFSTGKVGKAFTLDGSSCVVLNNNGAIQLQDFTIETWIQRGSVNGTGDYLIFGFGSTGMGIGLTSGGTPFLTKLDVDNTMAGVAITDTNFHHLAVTKAGTTVNFYVDGTRYTVPPYTSGFSFGSPAAIGGRGDIPASSANFVGKIDELSIYDHALTQSEVQGIYNAGSAGKCVGNAPSIVLSPANQSVAPGARVSFSVYATGDGPLSYHWLFNGTNLAASNDYTLVITNAQASNSGTYSVAITSPFGSATSAPAILSLFLPPVIVNQPVSQTNYVGGTAIFSVGTANGSGPLAYQWRFNGTNLAGATGSSVNVDNVQFSDSGNYAVVITNAVGQVISSNASLTVLATSCDPMPSGLVGWWQGEKSFRDVISGNAGTPEGNVTYVPGRVGSALHFDGYGSAVLVGNSTNYQLQDFTVDAWIKRTYADFSTPGGGGAVIFSYGSEGYGFGLLDSGQLFLTKVDEDNVKASCQVADTNWHHVAVTKADTNVVFYLDGAAYQAPAYSTFYSFDTGVAIGARGDDFESSFLGSVDEVDLFNRALSASEIHSLYAASSLGKCPVALTVPSQSANQSFGLGSNATLSVSVAGTGPMTYQWFQNGVLIAGATNATLTLADIGYFQAGNYSVNVGNSLGMTTVSNIMVYVQPPPLLVNGSFETGDFTGWVPTDISLSLFPASVQREGFEGGSYQPGFGFSGLLPSDGHFFAMGGFEGDGPGSTSLAQDIFLPSGPALLTFDYGAAWDMLNYGGSTVPRSLTVTLQPYGGGAPIQTFTMLIALPHTANPGTGWLNGLLDLTSYSGRWLRISFNANVPESFTGPGIFELDHVVLAYSALPPLLISRTNNNLVLTWPASATNCVLQANASVADANGWSAVNTNSIVRGAISSSATLALPSHPTFYRLKSP